MRPAEDVSDSDEEAEQVSLVDQYKAKLASKTHKEEPKKEDKAEKMRKVSTLVAL